MFCRIKFRPGYFYQVGAQSLIWGFQIAHFPHWKHYGCTWNMKLLCCAHRFDPIIPPIISVQLSSIA